MNSLNIEITTLIKNLVSQAAFDTKYRPPRVGFADAHHPMFHQLNQVAHPDHWLPADLLEGARSVVSFFIPFYGELVRANQNEEVPTRAWVQAKKDTDEVISQVIDGVRQSLVPQGVRVSANPALQPYDATIFAHRWSQKHVGYICGLGNFGLHRLLITKSGCAGRLGSFVIDAETEPNAIATEPYCPYQVDLSCGLCVKKCPAQALRFEGLDKARCSEYQDTINARYYDGVWALRACGKCITLPCALRKPRMRGGE
jgi:epoxyqueuosine reductase